MQRKISRRSLVKSGLIAGALLPSLSLLSRNAAAASLPPLDPNDPTAKALGFTTMPPRLTARLIQRSNPAKMRNLRAIPGQVRRRDGACTIFAGKSVPQGGWCQVWAQKG